MPLDTNYIVSWSISEHLSMRFEALVAVLALRIVQWNGKLCSSVVSHQNFGGKYFLLQNTLACLPNYMVSHPKIL